MPATAWAAPLCRASSRSLPCEIIPLYFELDGTFPNHEANPIEPENIRDLQRTVVEQGCDLGVAFDGDADRMFLIDEHGAFVGGDMTTAMVSIQMLRKHPGFGDRLQPDLLAHGAGNDLRDTADARSAPASATRSSRP